MSDSTENILEDAAYKEGRRDGIELGAQQMLETVALFMEARADAIGLIDATIAKIYRDAADAIRTLTLPGEETPMHRIQRLGQEIENG